MRYVNKSELEKIILPGRVISKCVGKDGYSKSKKMTMGFATYSEESGPMEPHHHAEEICYVINCKDGWIRYGSDKGKLINKVMLKEGMTLHFEELEWHVFEYDKDGFVEIIYFYGQVDNIRPEEVGTEKL